MTNEEVQKLAALIQLNYPQWKPTSEKLLVAMWTKLLAEDSYEAMEMALIRYIRTSRNGFPPSIGQLLGCWDEIRQETEVANLELHALGCCPNRTYRQVAMGEHATLGEDSRRLIG